MLKNIVTHPGTGTETVREVLGKLGAKVHVVYSKHQVESTRFDGAILLGGADVDPRFYGENDEYCYRSNRNRDAVEWLIARRCLAERLPIFGICRGHQMLAVAAGGALYQDIEAQGATTWHPSRHRLTDVDPKFGKMLPTHSVNSLHHQAVKAVPFGFRIVARAHDGLVEAIWRPGYLGVQWHPELLIGFEAGWITLFEWLVEDGLA